MSFTDKYGKSGSTDDKKSFADKYKRDDKNTSFVEQNKNKSGELVYLVRGKDKGMAAWHYVLVDKNKLPLFLKKIESGNIDVSLYGDILYSGWGEDPSDDIVKKIEEQYG